MGKYLEKIRTQYKTGKFPSITKRTRESEGATGNSHLPFCDKSVGTENAAGD